MSLTLRNEPFPRARLLSLHQVRLWCTKLARLCDFHKLAFASHGHTETDLYWISPALSLQRKTAGSAPEDSCMQGSTLRRLQKLS